MYGTTWDNVEKKMCHAIRYLGYVELMKLLVSADFLLKWTFLIIGIAISCNFGHTRITGKMHIFVNGSTTWFVRLIYADFSQKIF